MANIIINKFDRLINMLTMLILVGGGSILHTLTALALKNYYGDPWGYVSFALPGLAEAYLIIIQLSDEMYNYTLLFAIFACAALAAVAVWAIKNIVRQRMANMLQQRG